MSEPKAIAAAAEEVVPGVWHWRLDDDRIGGFVSSAHAVSSDDGTVLIDPLPLAADALATLGDVVAICLTSGAHQRSAWRYRNQFGASVYAPALSRSLEEEPDERYREGDVLPGALRTVFTPGAGTTQHTLLRGGEPGIAFVSDLFVHPAGGSLELTPAEYVHDPAEQRRSVEKLLGLPFTVLCVGHGTPVARDPKAAIRATLER